MGVRSQLTKDRHRSIQRFLEDNAEVFGIKPEDGVGEGPFFLSDWCLVLLSRDLSVDDEDGEPNEIQAAFFRPGMTYSQKLGLIELLKESVQNPRIVEDEDEGPN